MVRIEEVRPLRISKVKLQFAVVVADQVVLLESCAVLESELSFAEGEFELSGGEEGGRRTDSFGHINRVSIGSVVASLCNLGTSSIRSRKDYLPHSSDQSHLDIQAKAGHAKSLRANYHSPNPLFPSRKPRTFS